MTPESRGDEGSWGGRGRGGSSLLTRGTTPGESARRGFCAAAALAASPVSGRRRLPSTRVALGGRSTSMSLVDRAVARSPYLAAITSCDQGASASSTAEGVWKFPPGALIAAACRLPIAAVPLEVRLPPSAAFAAVLLEKKRTSRSCDEP